MFVEMKLGLQSNVLSWMNKEGREAKQLAVNPYNCGFGHQDKLVMKSYHDSGFMNPERERSTRQLQGGALVLSSMCIFMWCRLPVVTEINSLLDCEQENSDSNPMILADKDSKLDLDYLWHYSDVTCTSSDRLN